MSGRAEYDREAAVRYAARWAMGRNPEYADFTGLGGDCANFVSQCLYAGARVMDRRANAGWYYRSVSDRSPAWSGVRFLNEYLLRGEGMGPAGRAAEIGELEKGDVVFLRNSERLYHVLLVTAAGEDPLVAAHTVDSWMRPLSTYEQAGRLGVRIEGVRR